MSLSLDNFNRTVQQSREKVPKKLASKINEIARKAIEEMSEEAGKFLHDELDDDKHTEEQVKAIIELFPDSLSQVDDDGNLPIQRAAVSGHEPGDRSFVTFVPLLAKEGCRLGVGGEGERGGLFSLVPDGSDENTMQWFVSLLYCSDGDPAKEFDSKRVQVLKKLRDMILLKKADIEEHHLVNLSLHPRSKRRFEFFVSWHPDSLRARVSAYFALKQLINSGEMFEMALKAGMKHFPEYLGFLFWKVQGTTVIKNAFDKIAVSTVMNIIRKCIPPTGNHLILHHAVEHAPDLVDEIAQYYPDAVLLRDANGHTLSQVKFYINLRRGSRTFKKHSTFFLEAADDQVNSIDPKTGLCPFMLAAVNNKSDLAAVYYLLCRNPKLVGSHEKRGGKDSDESRNSRKRQREEIS